jgi:hypothetical protein
MKRLVASKRTITADNELNDLLDKIQKSIDDVIEKNAILLNNINDLFNNYETVYDSLEQQVRIPTTNDIQAITDLKKNFDEILPRLKDDNYQNDIEESDEDNELTEDNDYING